MKKYIIVTVTLICFVIHIQISQAQITEKDTLREVITVGILDTNRTKSGFRINEYYIELSDSLFDAYKGKRIEVRGKVLTVKALEGDERMQVQGAMHDRLFITEPKIRIIYNR